MKNFNFSIDLIWPHLTSYHYKFEYIHWTYYGVIWCKSLANRVFPKIPRKNLELLLGIFCEFLEILSPLFLFFFSVCNSLLSWNGSDVKNFWVEVVTGIEMSHLSFQLVKIVIPPTVFNLHAH